MLSTPDIPDGDYETSFARHNKQIKAEIAKGSRKNNVVLGSLIEQSFAMRHRDILENSFMSKLFLKSTPFLKIPIRYVCNLYISLKVLLFMIQFFKETERICETERLLHLVRESWKKSWSNRIVEQANLEKESNSRLRDLMDSLKGTVIICIWSCFALYSVMFYICDSLYEKGPLHALNQFAERQFESRKNIYIFFEFFFSYLYSISGLSTSSTPNFTGN